MRFTLEKRRKLLETKIGTNDYIKLTEQFPFSKWKEVMKQSVKEGGEGAVFKLKDKPYEYKQLGRNEARPGFMFKFKGGGLGKNETDDFVIYDYEISDKNKLKAYFGQFYKGKLYGISTISNFSKKDELEIQNRLKNGLFTVEIEFQERVPGGLRHQKFLRYRDDKKPKDATMNKFYIDHIDNLKLIENVKRAGFAIDLLKELKDKLNISPGNYSRNVSNVDSPLVDFQKAYEIFSTLESNKSYLIGDSGTAFGTTQVQFGNFITQLLQNPDTQSITGMSDDELQYLLKIWNTAKKNTNNLRLWDIVPIEKNVKEYVNLHPESILKRREGIIIRLNPSSQPGVIKIINGKIFGFQLNLNDLQNIGIDVEKNYNEINLITQKYVTDGVVRNALAKLIMKNANGELYNKFYSTFSVKNVNHNRELRELADTATKSDFANRVSQVVDAVKKYNYDVTDPNAYNIYQLIGISNASGIGRVIEFLKNKKAFTSSHLHYLQRGNSVISKITGLSSAFPPNGGLGGFKTASFDINLVKLGYERTGDLYFPLSYAEHIRSGKRKMAIRDNDVPVEVSKIARCMSYSGGHVCDLFITSKEWMSINRIGKAFGDRVAKELERRSGSINGKQFMVIRFDVFDNINSADDDDEKWKEVLIEKDGVSLTRQRIKDHYMKSDIRKKIMDRIKGNPIIVYIGVEKNKNILKRNHNGKPIIITNDDVSKKEDTDNYFYWVNRRLLSIHQVFEEKTDLGIIDLDIHGNFSIKDAKEYAKSVVKEIKENFKTDPVIYESGGTGLHIEFNIRNKIDIDKFRAGLKEILDGLNEGRDDVSTGMIKGNGLRSDISTFHNKGSLRVPFTIGEVYGKVKKPIFSSNDVDDNFGKYTNISENLDIDSKSLNEGVLVGTPIYRKTSINSSMPELTTDEQNRIMHIWKLAGLMEEEEAEYEKFFNEYKDELKDDVEGDEADEWLKNYQSGKEVGEETEKEEKGVKPVEKKVVIPKKTFYDQIKGEIPEELKQRKKKEKVRKTRDKEYEDITDKEKIDLTYEDLFGGEQSQIETKQSELPKVEPKIEEQKVEIPKIDYVDLINKTLDSEKFENIKTELDKKIEDDGKTFHSTVVNLSPEEIRNYLLKENEFSDVDSTILDFYINELISRDPGFFNFPEDIIKKELKERILSPKERKQILTEIKTGREKDEGGEQFAIDDAFTFEKSELKSAKPKFTNKLEPPVDEKGKIAQSWPTVQLPTDITDDFKKYFHPDNLSDGPSIRKIFTDPRAWDALRKNPELLQQWILPSIIMSIGYKWFEINSIKENVGMRAGKDAGITFKHLQGGAPFSMLDEIISSENIKKIQSGEISVSDLPEAKEYVQHINRITTDLTNMYFSKENPLIPIDEYIYKGLQNEMIKIVAEKNGFKRNKLLKCSICKFEADDRTEIDPMVLISKGFYKCKNCERIADSLNNELNNVKDEINLLDRKIQEYYNAKIRLENEEISDILRVKLEKIVDSNGDFIQQWEVQKTVLNKQTYDLNYKINLRSAQSRVPYFHILCPNPNCKLQRIPITAVDWENEIWKTQEGEDLKKKLKEKYQIESPGPIQTQDAEDEFQIPVPSYIKKKFIPSDKLSWIYSVPFKCPNDGIKFKMKEVIGEGYKGMAGFFYYPFEKTVWKPKNPSIVGSDIRNETDNQAPVLSALKPLSDKAFRAAKAQYYDFYTYLRMLDVALKSGKETFEVNGQTYDVKPLTKAQKTSHLRELLLYKTISNFVSDDMDAYLNWLSGSELLTKSVYKDGVVQERTVARTLSYTEKRDQIYLPILQKWVDNMSNIPDFVNKFSMKDWLVKQGDKLDDGTYSEDGIPSDGPGTYFIAKINGEITEDKLYGFSCNLQSKRQKISERTFDKRGPRLLRVLDIYKITGGNLTDDQINGIDYVPKPIAESLITGKENLIYEMKDHNFHDVSLDGSRTTLVPGDLVLVRCLLMPGKFYHGPLINIQNVEKNKRDFEFWDKFYELVRMEKNNPEFWKEFEKKTTNVNEFFYSLENMINRDLFKTKKSFDISLSKRSDLKQYNEKRDFKKTNEPKGKESKKNKHRFVIQNHIADRAGQHFDLRLENDEGTLSSWSIPKHKLPTKREKLLAISTEDHPIDYMKFEGEIQKGEYGGGKVEIYDSGTFDEIKRTKNKIVFKLKGKKENGIFNLIKTEGNKWLIMADKVEQNSDDGYEILYHIGKRPARPVPLKERFINRYNPVNEGFFMTDNYTNVGAYHGIIGNVYAYKVSKSVIEQAGGLHKYDNAHEIIIPGDLFADGKNKGEIIFLGKKLDEIELQNLSEREFNKTVNTIKYKNWLPIDKAVKKVEENGWAEIFRLHSYDTDFLPDGYLDALQEKIDNYNGDDKIKKLLKEYKSNIEDLKRRKDLKIENYLNGLQEKIDRTDNIAIKKLLKKHKTDIENKIRNKDMKID